MSRSIWNGAISFGLVTIPVRLHGAIEEKDISFNQLHAEDNGRIRYKRVCEVCGKEVSQDEIIKGYQYEKDTYVVFSKDDVQRIPPDSSRAIDIVAFVDLEQIDPIYFQRPYYLVPEKTGIKAYRLLEKALTEAGKVGIAKISLRDKEHLATLRVRDGVFILETMHWPDEIREVEFEELGKAPEIRKQELEMARNLINNLSADFEPQEFKDEYRVRLEEAIQSKIEGEEIAVPPAKEPTKVVDLMEALKASVEATKSGAAPEEKTTKSKAKAKAKAKSA
jgi:DNA end-binding protein Ku